MKGASGSGPEETIRVVLADDHNVVREALRVLLDSNPDISVTGEARNGVDALRVARELLPDVLILDYRMPLLNGVEAARIATRELPGTRVLMLSCRREEGFIREALHAGAAGYVSKEALSSELFDAIRAVHRGEVYLGADASEAANGKAEPDARGKGQRRLTARQKEVLQLIAEGQANKQIAAALCISIKTVEKHRQELMNKLNIHHTAGLTRYAVETGMVA